MLHRLSMQRAPGGYEYSNVENLRYRTRSLTLGTTQVLTPSLTNEFHFNYSLSRASSSITLDDFGGATPPSDSALFPSSIAPPGSNFVFLGDGNALGLGFITGALANNLESQVNVTDKISATIGAHQMKFGLDYRRLSPKSGFAPYQVQYDLRFVIGRSRKLFVSGIRSFENPRRATGLLKLEPVCTGFVEYHAHIDGHLRSTVGLQRRAFRAQRESSVYRDGRG